MTDEFLNIRLPTPDAQYSAQNERELRRQIELAFRQVSSIGSSSSATADGIYAVEAYLWNNGSTIIAGDSDWVYVPTDFTITDAEIVSDPAGTISVEVYASAYATWDTFTKISASAPLTLTASDKNRPALTGWTTSFTGGTYLRFTVTGTPTSITKATITLNLNVVNASLADLAASVYASAINRANHTGTQLASTISDFDSATRAQTESELVAGSNITITPASTGATRTLTIAAAGAALTVKDEGSTLSSAVTSIDFTGAGVTATGTTSVSVAIPGGGGSVPAWVTNHPDNPPTSPDAMDDEFTGASLNAKWTLVDLGTVTASVTKTYNSAGWLTYSCPSSIQTRVFALTQPAPAGTWRIRSKMAFDSATWNYFGLYLIARRASASKTSLAGAIYHSSFGAISTIAAHINEPSTLASETDLYDIRSDTFYLELEYDGTNLIWRMSKTGMIYTRFWSETAASHLGAAPTTIGINFHFFAQSSDANHIMTGSIDWFRRVA